VLLADTNIWLAAADRRSDRHRDCAQVLRNHPDLASPVPVIAETSWLILDRLGTGPHLQFLRTIIDGHVEGIDLTRQDWQRSTELVATYSDLRLDLMDASLAAIAERLTITTIATLNHRDFAVVRPRHTAAFELIP
jgi:hypothetical protein